MPKTPAPDTDCVPWITDASCRNIAIVGICKNAGKTTLLNALLKQYPQFKWGVLSTGRDGESIDAVFKTPKPRVILSPGTIFCADAMSMNEHGSAITFLAKTPWQRSGKRLLIAEVNNPIATEIGGPGTAATQSECAALMHSLGAQKVLIDGSLDRKSIALSPVIDALLLVLGASYGTIAEISAELERLVTLASIPVTSRLDEETASKLLQSEVPMFRHQGMWISTGIKSLMGHEKELLDMLVDKPNIREMYIPGVYTSSLHHKLSEHLKRIKLLFRHPECIKLNLAELKTFVEAHQPRCLLPFSIKAVFINSTGIGSHSLDADLLRQKLRQAFPELNLYDLMEL